MAVTAKNSVPCLNCGKNLPISNYIKSKTNAVGVVPICRGCLQELSLENGVLSGFYPFTSSEWGLGMYTPFFEKNFASENKKQPKTLYLRDFSAEKIF